MAKLFFIGDSITTGAWDEQGGWANRVLIRTLQKTMKAEQCNENFYCLPYNIGVSGDTVPDVLDRLEDEVKRRLDPDAENEKVEFLISIGVNDSIYMLEEDAPRFTNEQFKKNIENLIKQSNKLAQRVSFFGLSPVDDTLLNPIPWAPDKAYILDRVKQFNKIIQKACQNNNVPFLSILDDWLALNDFKDFLFDGVHPNNKGHALMAEKIEPFLFNDAFYAFHTE